MVAVLYVDPRGPYPKMLGVECWDEQRDARLYSGPGPVVAHPPCGPWGRLRHLSRKDDPALALRAVEQVRAHGGILEHPQHSRLFAHCKLPLPGDPPDEHGGYTIEVCQCDWGHVARKRTWLYMVGVARELLVFPDAKEPTHWMSGGRTTKGSRGVVPPGVKVCSAQQRRRTPWLFALWLVSLAKQASK
jgi:hypothetical protein